MTSIRIKNILALLCLIGFATTILWPGLNGPLLLDDKLNLYLIEPFLNQPDFSLSDFVHLLYEKNKHTRAIAFFTFALQYPSWPDSPFDFKLANLIIHYINAGFVALVLYQVIKLLYSAHLNHKQIVTITLVITFLWLIHPIQQSAIFYLVQRMAQLSALFTLIGINLYLYLRPRLNLNRFSHFLFLTLNLGICLVFSTFSKENGLLLVLYIWLIEKLFEQKKNIPTQFYFLIFKAIIIYLPLILFVAYLFFTWPHLSQIAELREIPPVMRMMTETRILFMYIHYTLIPDVFSGGLFHDHIPISQSLFSPITTLLSLLALTGLTTLAWIIRKQHFPLFFGTMWFLISHSIESTFIPLELYFEHRNYLALLGIIGVMVYLLILLSLRFKKITLFFSCCYLVLILLFSWQGALIWSSSEKIYANWAAPNTQSPRAQNYMADYWLAQKKLEKAIQIYDKATINNPRDLMLRLKHILLYCQAHKNASALIDTLISDMSRIEPEKNPALRTHVAVGSVINLLYKHYQNQTCRAISHTQMLDLVDKLLLHPHHQISGIKTDLYYVQGKLLIQADKIPAAINAFEQSFSLYPDPRVAIILAKWLIQSHQYERARHYLQNAEKSLTNSGKESLTNSGKKSLTHSEKKPLTNSEEKPLTQSDDKSLLNQIQTLKLKLK